MKVSPKHLLRQGPVLESLFKTVTSSLPLGQLVNTRSTGASRRTIHKDTVPPRDPDLVRAYIQHVGGDLSWYRGVLPPHMFPQWGFALMARTLQSLPYNLVRALNGGSKFEVIREIPANETLLLRARIEEVKEDENKAVLTQRLETGTAEHPKCLVSHVSVIIPFSGGKKKDKSRKKESPRVPVDAREIGRMHLNPKCGLEFGFVTGDINPIHWFPQYARMSGFKNPILHGFSAMARAIESMNRTLWSGNVSTLKSFEARFVRPLVLPATVGVFIDEQGGIFVGKAPGGPASLVGSYTTK
jgi:MaoC like domain